MAVLVPRLRLPRFLEQGRAVTLTEALEDLGGSVVAPASATYALYDSDGAEVVAPAAATVAADGSASYALPSDFAQGYSLPESHPWREQWSFTGGSVSPSPYTVEHEVYLVRRAPVMRVNATDLYGHHPELRRQLPNAFGDIGEPIVTAWRELVQRILSRLINPAQITNTYALGLVHKYWALHLISRAFADDDPSSTSWEQRATDYWARAQNELEQRVGLRIDRDDDGVVSGRALEAAEPPLYLTNVPHTGDPRSRS